MIGSPALTRGIESPIYPGSCGFLAKKIERRGRSYGGVIPIEESQENKTTRAGINIQRQHMREFRHFIRKYLN